MRISDWSSDVCSSDLVAAIDADLRTVTTVDDTPHAVQIGAANALQAGAQMRRQWQRRNARIVSRHDRLSYGCTPSRWLHRSGGRRAAACFGLPSIRPACRDAPAAREIGRATCRGRVGQYGLLAGVAVSLKKKKTIHSKNTHNN